MSVKDYFSAGYLAVSGKETHYGKRGYGFSASGFSYQPQNLSFIDGKGNIIYGRDPCFIPLEFSAEIFYFQ